MIKIIDFDKKKILSVAISGKISADDIENISKIAKEKFKNADKLSIYVEMESFEGISLGAFFKDLKFGLKNIGKFDKKAVVTDKAWVNKLGEFSDKLFGSIEIRCFPFEEKDAAKEWVSV